MATSPSQTWEDGKLATRAQDARGATEENTAQAVTGRANDTPVRSPEDAPLGGNSTFGSRGKDSKTANRKAVESGDTEDKAVGRSERKSKGRR